MAIISCPECEKEISDKASACPGCGAPVTVASAPKEVTTIQQTGRDLKIQQAFAVLLTLSGMAGCVMDDKGIGLSGDPSVGFYVFLAGGIWLMIVQFNIWMRHG